MQPGFWIDSGGQPEWTIGDNPAVRGSFTKGEGLGELRRASEPINSMYKKAFIHHIRENQVRLLKFDNLPAGRPAATTRRTRICPARCTRSRPSTTGSSTSCGSWTPSAPTFS